MSALAERERIRQAKWAARRRVANILAGRCRMCDDNRVLIATPEAETPSERYQRRCGVRLDQAAARVRRHKTCPSPFAFPGRAAIPSFGWKRSSSLDRGSQMPKPTAGAVPKMLDQIAVAIAKADGGGVHDDPARYRRLALAALKPLVKPTDDMIDAAHEAVWSDAFWAINSRRDFQKAVRAMIRAVMKEGAG